MGPVVQGVRMDTGWMSRRRCKGMDPALFFPSDGGGGAGRVGASPPAPASTSRHRKVPSSRGKPPSTTTGPGEAFPLAPSAAVGHG